MEKSSKVIIVGGLAGVGKTTVLNKLYNRLTDEGKKFHVFVYGTVMLEEAERLGVKDRDEMRNLSFESQKELQVRAARKIAADGITFIDTHYMIPTPYGYLPGLPAHVLAELKPTHLVLLLADPSEIIRRRMNDLTRKRETKNEADINYEIQLSRIMVGAASMLTGAIIVEIYNRENMLEQTVEELIKKLEL
ncbi:MAG: adenylate kinase [Conexivisphaerales archaeon]